MPKPPENLTCKISFLQNNATASFFDFSATAFLLYRFNFNVPFIATPSIGQNG